MYGLIVYWYLVIERMSITKTFVYINRKAPYGSIYALEALDVVLISASFEQEVKLIFMDDGVLQLLKDQDPAGIGMKNFSKTYAALGDYGISHIYVDEQSLIERGLHPDDLQALVYEDDNGERKNLIRLLSRAQLSDVIESADVLLNF